MNMLGSYKLNEIYTGDARELAKAIPDESVDLIFTDPPYLREFLWTYEFLADLGARILRPGGYLFAYGAGEHMPASLAGMERGGLKYFWTFILLHNGGWPRMWNKRLMSGYKPVFVFTKGTVSPQHWMGTVHSDAMDKQFHEWGQGTGFPIKMIDMLAGADTLIVDPFTGGGTVPAVCKMLGRNYLAFEIDPDTAEMARQRVANTQPPLFVPEAEQLNMFDSEE